MRKITVNGKKAYAKTNGNLMTLYGSILDYILDIPDPQLMYMYSRENGVDTVLDRILKSIKEMKTMKDKIYVRNTFGDIYKVDDLTDVMYKTDFLYNRIVKQSNNIIDLIEIGDLVNGYRVTDKYLFAGEKPVLETEGNDMNCKCLCEEDIKEILTKEKYNQECFKVVE